MAGNHKQPGEVIPFVLTGTVASGAVVRVGQTLGVALNGGASGETIMVAIKGVFEVPKVSGAVIKAGERLVWDVSAAAFDDNAAVPATGDVSGESAMAFEDAGSGVTVMDVLFTGVPGTVA